MAVSSVASSLNTYFTDLVTQLMSVERQPLTRLTGSQITLQSKRSAVSDMGTKLSDLLTVVKDLTTDTTSAVFEKKLTNVTNRSLESGSIITASALSSAIDGTYDISVTQLAREHRVRSDRQTYANQALNLSGTFVIGGDASRSAIEVATIADTLTAFGTADLDSDQKELGTDTYSVEVRNDAENGWQFRLVDSDGNAVSVQDAEESGAYTSNWQSIPAGGGLYDTGRGLSFTFGADDGLYQAGSLGAGAAELDYTAQGASITVDATDTLEDIAEAINEAVFASGNEVAASVVDRQLVLAAKESGSKHQIVVSDTVGTVLNSLGVWNGSAFTNSLQTALNANFSVNGIAVARSRNTGLTDVISGVTLNLQPDAEDQSASLTISDDDFAVSGKVQALVNQFNTTISTLQTKTETTTSGSSVSGDASYTRGILADEMAYTNLRAGLLTDITRSVSGLPAGAPKSLRDIGITLEDGLQLTLDSAKLTQALAEDRDGVEALLNAVTDRLQTRLERFTNEDAGYTKISLDQLDGQIEMVDDRISDFNKYLIQRENALTAQYGQLQAQLAEMIYVQQQMSAISGSGVNTFA